MLAPVEQLLETGRDYGYAVMRMVCAFTVSTITDCSDLAMIEK
jgi:hypothetical protein